MLIKLTPHRGEVWPDATWGSLSPDQWQALYPNRMRSWLLSSAFNIGIVLLLSVVTFSTPIRAVVKNYLITPLTTPPDLIKAPKKVQHTVLATRDEGGGGGSQHQLRVSRGRLPLQVPREFIPPVELTKLEAKLVVPSEIEAPKLELASKDLQYGDPKAPVSPFSLGQGIGGGIGQGQGKGLGSGDGPGLFSGRGGKIGGSHKSPTGGIQGATCIRKVQPQYTAEARTAGWTGSIKLVGTISIEGRVVDVRAASNPCPYPGMLKNAIAAALQWEFKPAMRNIDNQPVVSVVEIVVDFILR